MRLNLISLLFVICFFALSLSSFAQAIQQPTADKELHYGSGSYLTLDSTPRVEILSFLTGEDETTVTSLKNWSQKDAVSARIGWYLTTTLDSRTILASGQTKLIDLGTLSPGQEISKLQLSIVTKKGVITALKGNVPDGHLFLGVAVNEIHYADGTTWTLKIKIDPLRCPVPYAYASVEEPHSEPRRSD